MMAERDWLNSRRIIERVVVEGSLVLEKPAHFGNGDVDELSDMPLLLDDQGNPLLTGASIAGALRNYLRDWELGFSKEFDLESERKTLAVYLFGGARGDDKEGAQSPLIVDDAHGEMRGIELRDGDPRSRTAEDKHKFDIELLEAGTVFQLRFELLVSEGKDADRNRLLCALALALGGLERGEIALGKRKSRGYGRCRLREWSVTRYDLKEEEHLLAWLTTERDWDDKPTVAAEKGGEISSLLGVADKLEAEEFKDHRRVFKLDAEFQLDGSLLIRSGAGPKEGPLPDAIHLHSRQVGSDPDDPREPVLPGTSLAGALRHRALRIAQTLAEGNGKARQLVEEMFGPERKDQDDETTLKASRVIVEETPISGGNLLVQNRIRIDRFTGGAYEGALFNEAPIFGGSDSYVRIELALRNPKEHEIGLLLLLLKDLWTGDLPIGGESSVGRGRLEGRKARLELRTVDDSKSWEIKQDEEKLTVSGTGVQKQLEGYVEALARWAGSEVGA
jgi:CRISPR/Cas system CSM-associated protein Csm3 (group 7 of RAMP superfamily)